MIKRPNPALWVWYAAGGRLPDEYREWVLRDVAGPRWALRHVLRSAVLIWPLAAVWWLLPASAAVHAGMSLLALIVGHFYSCAYMVESADHRLVKHGYPHGTFAATRAEATSEAREQAEARYDAVWRQS